MSSKHDSTGVGQSEDHETLGEVMRDLRESIGETQGTFADRFSVGRTRITEMENNYLSAAGFRPALAKNFPQAKERIKAALDKYEPRPKLGRNGSSAATIAELRRNVERLMTAGQSESARQLLEAAARLRRRPHPALPDVATLGPEDRYWIANQLYFLYAMRGDDRRADRALHSAYVDAGLGRRMSHERIECAVRIAQRHLKSESGFARVREVLAETLSEHPDAPQLWLQRGELLWIEQAYEGAYAALTTALTLNADRKEVLRLRSQVLAEWDNVDSALNDIVEYYEYPATDRVHECEVLSAHAYVLTVHPVRHLRESNRNQGLDLRAQETSDLEKADGLFAKARLGNGKEVGLVNYRMGYHYLNGRNDLDAALASYRQALASDYPLDPIRLRLVRELIKNIEMLKLASAAK